MLCFLAPLKVLVVMGRGENSSYPQTNQIHALALAFILLAMNFYFCLCNLDQPGISQASRLANFIKITKIAAHSLSEWLTGTSKANQYDGYLSD